MTTAICLGIPPKIPPCGWEGETDAGAEKHTRSTMHSTSSGATRAGVEAVVRACSAERKTT